MDYPAPERRDYALEGGTLSAWHFGPMQEPIKLVFLHANGFNGLSYRHILQPLGVHAVALDLRGHGFTQLPAHPADLRGWDIFCDDICEFVERYVASPVIIAGHSLGAVIGILAAQRLTDKMSGYLGFDPVFLPRSMQLFASTAWGRSMMKRYIPIMRKAGERRRYFESQEAAFERYKGRGAFKKMLDEILNDYLSGGLRPHHNGVQLSCAPLWEQAIFCTQGHNIFAALHHLPKHRRLTFAGKGSFTPKISRKKASKILGANALDYVDDAAHLFPFYTPNIAVNALRDMIARVEG